MERPITKARNNSIEVNELIFSPIEALFKAFDSILILVFFNIAISNFILYDAAYTYSYLPEFRSQIMKLFLFTLSVMIQILLIKRILYHLRDKEINIKKIFTWESIIRGIKVYFHLLLINLPSFGFVLILMENTQENSDNISLMGLIILLLCIIFISLFVILYNFIVIEKEGSINDSFKDTILLLKGNKIKLMIITFIIYLAASLIIYFMIEARMHSFYMNRAQMQAVESFIKNIMIIAANLGFILYLGYYYGLNFNRKI